MLPSGAQLGQDISVNWRSSDCCSLRNVPKEAGLMLAGFISMYFSSLSIVISWSFSFEVTQVFQLFSCIYLLISEVLWSTWKVSAVVERRGEFEGTFKDPRVQLLTFSDHFLTKSMLLRALPRCLLTPGCVGTLTSLGSLCHCLPTLTVKLIW